MHILYKLQKIPITIRLLEETKIGYKVRALSKKEKDNDIGKMAKLLTIAWKKYVRNHRDSDNEHNGSDEKEQPDEEDEKGDEDDEDEGEEEEESLSKKKHHKKKKKKSSREDLSNEDEATRREKKKEKKKKHREEDGESREHKQHRVNNLNNDNIKSSPLPIKTNGTRKLELADDIFGTALAMGDRIKLENLARRQQQHSQQSSLGLSSLPSVINSSSNLSPSLLSTSSQQHRFNEPKTISNNGYLQKRDREMSNYSLSVNNNNNSLAYRTIQAQTNHSLAGMKMKGRTAVYAGSSKSASTVPKVYRLVDICLKVLMENVDRIYEVGDVPFELLRRVLAKCNVQQLERIEFYNPVSLYCLFCLQNNGIFFIVLILNTAIKTR